MKFGLVEVEKVKDIIESYCEGNYHLEFLASDLDEMVNRILAEVGVDERSDSEKEYDEESELDKRADAEDREKDM